MTIVSIRGTHGSGKSTIVRKILDKYHHELVEPDRKGRPKGYAVSLPGDTWLYVVGPYHTACGGCDAVQPYSLILDEIARGVRTCGDVLLEGALVSSSYGSVGHLMNAYATSTVPGLEHHAPHDAAFAFLDTPLDTCLERIKQRRAAKGNFEPLNPKNTAVKFENVARTKVQMAKLGSKVRIVDIDHTRPVMQVLKMFGVTLRKEP